MDRARGAAIIALIVMAAMRGSNCPAAAELRSAAGLPAGKLWRVLRALVRARLLEIERRTGNGKVSWRMRVIKGRWTDWTSTDRQR